MQRGGRPQNQHLFRSLPLNVQLQPGQRSLTQYDQTRDPYQQHGAQQLHYRNQPEHFAPNYAPSYAQDGYAPIYADADEEAYKQGIAPGPRNAAGGAREGTPSKKARQGGMPPRPPVPDEDEQGESSGEEKAVRRGYVTLGYESRDSYPKKRRF